MTAVTEPNTAHRHYSHESGDRQGRRGRPHTFRVCYRSFRAAVAAQFASTKLGARTAAVLYVGSDATRGPVLYRSVREDRRDHSGKEAFRTGELDYRAMLGKFTRRPDVMHPHGSEAARVKQARDLGFERRVLGGDSWGSPDIGGTRGGD